VLDRKWREHLYEMDYLREGIHLRAMAQRDPAVEYGREGFTMFTAMLDGIKEESVGFLFNVEVNVKPTDQPAADADADAADAALVAAQQAATPDAAAQTAPVAGGRQPAASARRPAVTSTAKQPAAVSAVSRSATRPVTAEPAPVLTAKGLGEPSVPKALQYSAPTLDSPEPTRKSRTAVKTATVTGSNGPSRNAPCPCGSGKKYKRCHGSPGGE